MASKRRSITRSRSRTGRSTSMPSRARRVPQPTGALPVEEFRKLSFATNQTDSLKGIDPDGSQRAWDLYVKTRFIDAMKDPARALGRRLRHADHQFSSGTVHPAAVHPAGRLAGARHPGIRRLGGQFRGDEDRPRAPALRPLQAGHEILRVRQCPRSDGDLSNGDRRRPQVRPPPISEAAGDRRRASADRRRAAERGLPRLSTPSRRPDKGDRKPLRQAEERRRHPALRDHRRPARRDRPALCPIGGRQRARQQAQRPDRQRSSHVGTNSEQSLYPARRRPLCPARRGADDLFRPRHAGRRRNPWLLRLSLDQGLPCRPRRAIGSDRLHAGLQEVLGETAPVQRRSMAARSAS